MDIATAIATPIKAMAWNLTCWFLLPAMLTSLAAGFLLPGPLKKPIASLVVLVWLYIYVKYGIHRL